MQSHRRHHSPWLEPIIIDVPEVVSESESVKIVPLGHHRKLESTNPKVTRLISEKSLPFVIHLEAAIKLRNGVLLLRFMRNYILYEPMSYRYLIIPYC